jgi:hypothetical protein
MTMNGGEGVGRPVDGHLRLLHRLQERGLGLGGGAVDLVADDDVGEDRARAELETPHVLVPDADPGDVAGQQVRRELHPAHGAVDRAGECLGEQRLAHARHVLDEQVTLCQEGGDRRLDDIALALEDRVHRAGERAAHLEDLGPGAAPMDSPDGA